MPTLPPTIPGVYPGAGQAALLRANQQQYLFQQQLLTAAQISAGGASVAVQLERINRITYPFACSVQVWFTNASGVGVTPGAFDVEAQTSDVDVDSQFSDTSGLTGGLNASFSGRIELVTNWMKFLRVRVPTFANASTVFLNALVSR